MQSIPKKPVPILEAVLKSSETSKSFYCPPTLVQVTVRLVIHTELDSAQISTELDNI